MRRGQRGRPNIDARCHGALEGDLNPAYISALAALARAIIGGLTSFATSWLTQRTQLRHAHREAEGTELKTLYEDFIASALRLFIEALTNKTDDINDITGIGRALRNGRAYALGFRSDSARCGEAGRGIETYLGPDQTIRELMEYARQGKMSFLVEFRRLAEKAWPPAQRQFGDSSGL